MPDVASPLLMAVPNVSEGRDPEAIAAIGRAFVAGGGERVRRLNTHADPDHHRAVFTLAGPPQALADSLLAGAHEAVARIDLKRHEGVHPHVGAIDVAPIVHLDAARRGAACAEALVVADRLANELELPVFLYGALAGGRTRAELRRGGPAALARRMASGELEPDFRPSRPHPTAGVALVAARPPLVAFNLELAPPATLEDARRIAVLIRESGAEGLPGVRAIGLPLTTRGSVQVSCNIEDPLATPLRRLIAAIRRHAEIGDAELVGLAPEAAFNGFPDDVRIPDFHAPRDLIEPALAARGMQASTV